MTSPTPPPLVPPLTSTRTGLVPWLFSLARPLSEWKGALPWLALTVVALSANKMTMALLQARHHDSEREGALRVEDGCSGGGGRVVNVQREDGDELIHVTAAHAELQPFVPPG